MGIIPWILIGLIVGALVLNAFSAKEKSRYDWDDFAFGTFIILVIGGVVFGFYSLAIYSTVDGQQRYEVETSQLVPFPDGEYVQSFYTEDGHFLSYIEKVDGKDITFTINDESTVGTEIVIGKKGTKPEVVIEQAKYVNSVWWFADWHGEQFEEVRVPSDAVVEK